MSIRDKIRQIANLLPNPIILVGPDGTVRLTSDHRWLSSLTSIGRPFLHIIHVDSSTVVEAAINALAPGHEVSVEAQLQTLSDQPFYTLLTIKALEDDSEVFYLIQLADITEQRLRENKTRHREKLWDDALTTSKAGVWDIDLKHDTVFCSDTWREIRGLSSDFSIETSVYDWAKYVHPDDRERIIYSVEQQNKGDPAYNNFTYRIQHANGDWIWIESRGSCIERDANGAPVRIAGTDTDVTDTMNAKKELELLSLRLKLALEVSQIGVFETNFSDGMAYWDRRTYEIFEIDPATTIKVGGIWQYLIHPEDRERTLSYLDDHIDRLEPCTCEYRSILNSGREIYVRARTVPFIDTDGIRKMIGTVSDVTQDVVLRKELERSKNLLETHNLELIEARNSIEHNALHDYLTDLPNRRYLDQELSRMAEHAMQEGLNLAILHIDLDRFKQINDTLGHHIGDVMLQHASNILSENRREGDFVARIGGDEFVIVGYYKKSVRPLTTLADKIITELRAPVVHHGHECRFGASIGIATSDSNEIDYKQLLLNADIALYNAKKRGRNRYEYFSEGTQDSIVNTKRISDEILLALERDEFIPYYQLQFDARTLNICGVETLARWKHPLQGILSPDRFIKFAEDLDVMADIDGLILEKALRDLRYWRQLGLHVPCISVNVSTRRLYDPDLITKLKPLAIQPGEVFFELLESIFLDDTDEVVTSNLKGLQKMNIGVEVDDFGTGHASIVSLLKIGPSTLKVDRALVQHATSSMEQRNLLAAIIDMGRSLGISVLAEGVETADQIVALRELGCDELQGYALCRPMPCEMLIDYIRTEQWRAIGNNAFSRKKINLAS